MQAYKHSTYTLRSVDRRQRLWIGDRKLDALVLQLRVHLHNPAHIGLAAKRLRPQLNQLQHFLLHHRWRIVFRSDQLYQLLHELFLGDEKMQRPTAVLHARLQHGQRVHDDRVVFAGVLRQPLADGLHRIACGVCGFVDQIAYLHVESPVLGRETGICCIFCVSVCERMYRFIVD